jgi:hypothetical protein
MRQTLLLAMLISASAYAGGGAHGGDAVRCYGKKGLDPKVYLFDYFQDADLNPNLKVDLGPPELS